MSKPHLETPTERLAARIKELEAMLQLSEDRNFYLAAANASLFAELEMRRRQETLKYATA